MKCKTIHKRLIFFIEGDLPAREMREVAEHLEECAGCASFAGEMKKTLGIIQTEKPVEVSPFFYTRLKARMEGGQEKVIPSGRFSLWEKVLQPALFSMLLLAGIYTGMKIGRRASDEEASSGFAATQVVPYLNEMESEPLETFLME